MRPEQKQLNMLGLAQRASELISGDEMVEKALKNHRIHLILLANDASLATQNRYQKLTQLYQVPMIQTFSKYEISHAIGKSRTICGITNKGMANKFISYVTGENSMRE